jgi:prepilin-type N-terminal cleavage/methylation domain-containing protein
MIASPASRRGFTLVEILVVLVIVGILASMGVAQYYKNVEVAKADHASSMTAMIGAAVRMYLVDHPNVTSFTASNLTSSCNTECCDDGGISCSTRYIFNNGSAADPCQIVACGYLSVQDFNCLPYLYSIGDPLGAPSTPNGAPRPGYAYAARQPNPPGNCADPDLMTNLGTNDKPFASWAYEYVQLGCVCPFGGAPASGSFNGGVTYCAQAGAGCE